MSTGIRLLASRALNRPIAQLRCGLFDVVRSAVLWIHLAVRVRQSLGSFKGMCLRVEYSNWPRSDLPAVLWSVSRRRLTESPRKCPRVCPTTSLIQRREKKLTQRRNIHTFVRVRQLRAVLWVALECYRATHSNEKMAHLTGTGDNGDETSFSQMTCFSRTLLSDNKFVARENARVASNSGATTSHSGRWAKKKKKFICLK